jgi:hypothetical protein
VSIRRLRADCGGAVMAEIGPPMWLAMEVIAR